MIYESPTDLTLPLGAAPLLASWDAKTHPAQVRLAEYLAHIDSLLEGVPRDVGRAIRLDVEVPEPRAVIGSGGDLDNYLYPVVSHLGPERFDSAWASKGRAPSAISLGPATPMAGWDPARWIQRTALTTGSTQSNAWKVDVHDQVGKADTGVGPLELHLDFRLSPERSWASLWKPAIDALGGLIGDGPRPYHPKDDRITLLGLHRTTDRSLGWDVQIEVWLRPAEG